MRSASPLLLIISGRFSVLHSGESQRAGKNLFAG
jgi:hypothetical protein